MSMTREELAEKLNNSEYPLRISPVLLASAKEAGLVIVYGASDDLIEIDGAFREEFGAYDGGEFLIDFSGPLPDRDSIEDDEELELFFARRPSASKVKALWCEEDDISWTYETAIPHSTFEVMEDDEIYCRGIVFAVADLLKLASGEAA